RRQRAVPVRLRSRTLSRIVRHGQFIHPARGDDSSARGRAETLAAARRRACRDVRTTFGARASSPASFLAGEDARAPGFVLTLFHRRPRGGFVAAISTIPV